MMPQTSQGCVTWLTAPRYCTPGRLPATLLISTIKSSRGHAFDSPQTYDLGPGSCPASRALPRPGRRDACSSHHRRLPGSRAASALARGHGFCFPVFSCDRRLGHGSRVRPLPGWKDRPGAGCRRDLFLSDIRLLRPQLFLAGRTKVVNLNLPRTRRCTEDRKLIFEAYRQPALAFLRVLGG